MATKVTLTTPYRALTPAPAQSKAPIISIKARNNLLATIVAVGVLLGCIYGHVPGVVTAVGTGLVGGVIRAVLKFTTEPDSGEDADEFYTRHFAEQESNRVLHLRH
jgi:hypothetical protein